MLEAISYPETFSLDSEGFSFFGIQSNVPCWYNFGTNIGGKEFKSIGSEELSVCLHKLLLILHKRKGKRLSEFESIPPFIELVGSDAEYISHLVFSGYNTLYFFMKDNYLRYVILADSQAKVLAHTELDAGLASLWLRNLSQIGIE